MATSAWSERWTHNVPEGIPCETGGECGNASRWPSRMPVVDGFRAAGN
jgi:hypothetical protein